MTTPNDTPILQPPRPRLVLIAEGWPHTADLLLHAPEGQDTEYATQSAGERLGNARLRRQEPLLAGHWSLSALDLTDETEHAFALAHRDLYDPRTPHRERVRAAIHVSGGAEHLAAEAGLAPGAGRNVRIGHHGRSEVCALAERHGLPPRLLLDLRRVDRLTATLYEPPAERLCALLGDAAATLYPHPPDLYEREDGQLFTAPYGNRDRAEGEAEAAWRAERDSDLSDLSLLTVLRVIYGARFEFAFGADAVRFAALDSLHQIFGPAPRHALNRSECR